MLTPSTNYMYVDAPYAHALYAFPYVQYINACLYFEFAAGTRGKKNTKLRAVDKILSFGVLLYLPYRQALGV